jgi:hypothetical protein
MFTNFESDDLSPFALHAYDKYDDMCFTSATSYQTLFDEDLPCYPEFFDLEDTKPTKSASTYSEVEKVQDFEEMVDEILVAFETTVPEKIF